MTYIPRLRPIPPLRNIMHALAMAAKKEDFVFLAMGGNIVQIIDVRAELLPLVAIIQRGVALGFIGPGDQAEV